MIITSWVVVNREQIPQGLDEVSGGNPFSTSLPGCIKHWGSVKAAQEYCNIINYGDKGYRVVKCETIVEI